MANLSSVYDARRGDDAIDKLAIIVSNLTQRIEVLERLVASLRAHTTHPPG